MSSNERTSNLSKTKEDGKITSTEKDVQESSGLLNDDVGETDLIHTAVDRAAETDVISARILKRNNEGTHRNNNCKCEIKNIAIREPPDGGYGWVVLVACTLIFFFSGGVWTSFSVFYTEFIHYFRASTATIGLIITVEAVGVFLTGAISSWPIRRFGTDKVMFIGGLISAAGCCAASLSTSVPMLFVTFGLCGCGVGFVVTSMFVAINQYFESKRVLANGICISGISVSTLTQPLIARWLIDNMSWRGAMLMIAGSYLQIMWLGLLVKPLNPYTKQEKSCSCHTKTYEKTYEDKTKIQRCFLLIYKIIDIRLFLDIRFVLFGCGDVAFAFLFNGFFLHLSNRAATEGFEPYAAAGLTSVLGLTNLVCRTSFGILGTCMKANNILTYAMALFLAGTTSILSIYAQTFLQFSVVIVFFGLFTAAGFVVKAPVLVDIFGAEALPKVNGVFQLFSIVAISAIPFAGFIYDVTQSYKAAYCIIGAISIFGGILVLICFVIVRYKKCIRN